jgi:hypothetical protein
MPLPTNNSRPAIPYNPEQVLPNHNRYGTLGKFPPTAQQLDGDFNGVVDLLNTLAGAINDTAAGIFPGADNPLNANKLPTTDGHGNVSWTHVTPFNLTDNAVHTRHIFDAAITPNKIQAQAVGTHQIADGAVATPKLLDNAVTTAKMMDNAITTAKVFDGSVTEPKLADGSVATAKIPDNAITTAKIIHNAVTTPKIVDNAITTEKVSDNAVTTPKIIDRAVTSAKIGSGAALENTFLAADGAGNANFIDKVGRILQIVNFEIKDALYDQAPCSPANPVSFSIPFLLRITPKKTGSKIIVFYSANISGGGDNYYGVVLCRNNTIWKVGTSGGAGGFNGGVTNGGYVFNQHNSHYGTPCFSNIFVDTGTIGQQIAYELKKATQYVTLNRSANERLHTISTMVAIEVDV